MPCLANRLVVVAVASYVVASLAHDDVVTGSVVAISVVVVLMWSRFGSRLAALDRLPVSQPRHEPAGDLPGATGGRELATDGVLAQVDGVPIGDQRVPEE